MKKCKSLDAHYIEHMKNKNMCVENSINNCDNKDIQPVCIEQDDIENSVEDDNLTKNSNLSYEEINKKENIIFMSLEQKIQLLTEKYPDLYHPELYKPLLTNNYSQNRRCKVCGRPIGNKVNGDKDTGICMNCVSKYKLLSNKVDPFNDGFIHPDTYHPENFEENNKETFSWNRRCWKCGRPIFNKSHTGLCNNCRDISGENNPFYGKKHTEDTINRIKENTSLASKKLWESDEYRNKVITNMTGIKRSDEFKETQRKHALEQFKNEDQRQIRAERMKQTWSDGNLTISLTKHIFSSRSKQEKNFAEYLGNYYHKSILLGQTFYYYEDGQRKHLYPDIVLSEDMIIIEYNGSYWHADPKIYNQDDLITDNKTAKDIWDYDNKKKQIYNSMGYHVIYVWSSDYIKDKNQTINNVLIQIENILNITKE